MFSMKEKARYVCGGLFSTPARVHDGKPGHEQSITKENTGWKRKQILSRRWGRDAWRGGGGCYTEPSLSSSLSDQKSS